MTDYIVTRSGPDDSEVTVWEVVPGSASVPLLTLPPAQAADLAFRILGLLGEERSS